MGVEMHAWVIWLIVAAALAVGEVATLGLVLGFVAVGAVFAAAVALGGGIVALQLVAFIAGALALLALLRPVATRHLQTPRSIRTGAAALVGAHGLVLERVDAHDGRVKIGGEVWSARAYDESQVIEPGATVEVFEIRGATALVYQ
ncbi:MAG TPA: NfeD family protein [Gaiellaceae bacterium]|jgi:membrane protein implicated in regulation of membrane protease activity|nr:NfeD family protein [Gaiellaceae bacterium]